MAHNPCTEQRDQFATAGSDGSVCFWECRAGESIETAAATEGVRTACSAGKDYLSSSP